MTRVSNRLQAQSHRTNPDFASRRVYSFVKLIAAMSLFAIICAWAGFSACKAAPRTGPDRAFTVGWRVTVPPAPHLWAAAFAPGTTKNAIVVGDNGAVLRTEDGGQSWRNVVLPPEFTSSLFALTFIDATNAVAVGENGAILRSENGGQSWTLVTLFGISARLRTVVFTSEMNGIIVGDAGTILHTRDGGKTWRRAKAPPEGVGDLSAVTFGKGGIPAFTGLATQPYSATEVDGWQHKLSRVSQNRAAAHKGGDEFKFDSRPKPGQN
jgi:hypothetical protein